MTPHHELDDLIDAASREASRTQEAQPRTVSGAQVRDRPALWPRIALALVVLAVGWALYSRLAPLPASQVQRDLEAAIGQARQSIEAARAPGGALPPALPNAALARIVTYEPEGDRYRLQATVLGIRVTLERDGNQRIEKVASP